MRKLLSSVLWLLPLILCSCARNNIVNLSHFDEVQPDFRRMKREGIVGVIHEATYPPRTVDFAYGSRQRAAADAGLLWGAYHFANATDPIQQADHFLSVVERDWRNASSPSSGVLMVLDFEHNGHYPGGTMRVDQAVAFVKHIKARTGKYPGLYSNENRIKEVINRADPASKRVLSQCWLWVANYHRQPSHIAPWSNWSMWQYTGDGICDLSRSSHPIHAANVRNAERNFFKGGSARAFWIAHAWRP